MSTAANPKANQLHPSDAPQEPTGAITSDSLAAESIKSGGAFSENDKAAISSVKGANSTLTNTDTSAASVLPAARDAAERASEEAKGLGSDEKGTTGATLDTLGQAKFSGTHSLEGYVGGSSRAGTSGISTDTGRILPSGATGDSFADGGAGLTGGSSASTTSANVKSGAAAAKSAAGTSGSAAQTSSTSASASGSGDSSSSSSSSSSNAGTAPNYAATVSGALRPEGEQKPKGENLIEGGIPETKTFTGDVGGQHDPGRLATQEFTKVGPGNAASAGESEATREGGPQISGGQYDVLSSERA